MGNKESKEETFGQVESNEPLEATSGSKTKTTGSKEVTEANEKEPKNDAFKVRND